MANRNSESRYLLIERTPMAMPFLDPSGLVNEKKNGKVSWYVKLYLLNIRYELYPIQIVNSYLIRIFSIAFRSGFLEKGSYLIVPSTTGCKLKKRRAQPSTNTQLVSFILLCL